jgi:hypothetical protein
MGALRQDGLADETVGRNITLTLTLTTRALNHEHANVRNIGQGEPRHRNIRGLNLAAIKHTTVQVTRLLL